MTAVASLKLAIAFTVALVACLPVSDAFAPHRMLKQPTVQRYAPPSKSKLSMALDLVTYLRVEWISAALFTNQTPRSADVALQLGTEDGRIVQFLPRTIREIITSSAEKDGKLTVSARRQLKQQLERRGGGASITYVDQPADFLKETEDDSVDIVVSMHAAATMHENGQDWQKSIREAARVLKPGGRFLFVEQTEVDGQSYLRYVQMLLTLTGDVPEDEEERFPIFDDIGYDDVDLVLTPHVAGVAIKSEAAGLSRAQRDNIEAIREEERMADLGIQVYERGLKKRKRRKKKKGMEETADAAKES